MIGQILLRVLPKERPNANAIAVPPNLEDYYLYIFGEIEENLSGAYKPTDDDQVVKSQYLSWSRQI